VVKKSAVDPKAPVFWNRQGCPSLNAGEQVSKKGVAGVHMPVAERNVAEIDEQLYRTVDAVERKRLLRLLIRELDNFARDAAFITTIERHIAKVNERIKRQKDLVARLKLEGHDTDDAYFLLITLKTLQALFVHHCTRARKVLVFVVPRRE
jgi:hypothetical protein